MSPFTPSRALTGAYSRECHYGTNGETATTLRSTTRRTWAGTATGRPREGRKPPHEATWTGEERTSVKAQKDTVESRTQFIPVPS